MNRVVFLRGNTRGLIHRRRTSCSALNWKRNCMSSFRVKCQWVGVALLVLLMGLRTEGADVYWTNLAGGSWTTAANWSTGVVPGANDHAFLTSNGTYTVSLTANASAGSVTVG